MVHRKLSAEVSTFTRIRKDFSAAVKSPSALLKRLRPPATIQLARKRLWTTSTSSLLELASNFDITQL